MKNRLLAGLLLVPHGAIANTHDEPDEPFPAVLFPNPPDDFNNTEMAMITLYNFAFYKKNWYTPGDWATSYGRSVTGQLEGPLLDSFNNNKFNLYYCNFHDYFLAKFCSSCPIVPVMVPYLTYTLPWEEPPVMQLPPIVIDEHLKPALSEWIRNVHLETEQQGCKSALVSNWGAPNCLNCESVNSSSSAVASTTEHSTTSYEMHSGVAELPPRPTAPNSTSTPTATTASVARRTLDYSSSLEAADTTRTTSEPSSTGTAWEGARWFPGCSSFTNAPPTTLGRSSPSPTSSSMTTHAAAYKREPFVTTLGVLPTTAPESSPVSNTTGYTWTGPTAASYPDSTTTATAPRADVLKREGFVTTLGVPRTDASEEHHSARVTDTKWSAWGWTTRGAVAPPTDDVPKDPDELVDTALLDAVVGRGVSAVSIPSVARRMLPGSAMAMLMFIAGLVTML